MAERKFQNPTRKDIKVVAEGIDERAEEALKELARLQKEDPEYHCSHVPDRMITK